MLFTYNPDFRMERKSTFRRTEMAVHLSQCLTECNIDEDRIVYVGSKKGERRTFVKESARLVRIFFEHHQVENLPSHVIFSDNGSAFWEEGESVLVDVGFEKHEFYPPDVHQFLSPNDNKLHGVAKQKWRKSGVDYRDDVKASIQLLMHLDNVEEDVRRNWWITNFMLGGKATFKRAQEVVCGNKTAQDQYFQRCYSLYKDKIGKVSK